MEDNLLVIAIQNCTCLLTETKTKILRLSGYHSVPVEDFCRCTKQDL